MIITRFIVYRHTLHCSFVHPTESLFFPTVTLSCEYHIRLVWPSSAAVLMHNSGEPYRLCTDLWLSILW